MKTLLDYFNELATKDYCNFVDFLRDSSPEEMQHLVGQLDNICYQEMYKHLDKINFTTKDDIVSEMDKFISDFELRDVDMWTMMDLYEYADEYIQGRYDEDDDWHLTKKVLNS